MGVNKTQIQNHIDFVVAVVVVVVVVVVDIVVVVLVGVVGVVIMVVVVVIVVVIGDLVMCPIIAREDFSSPMFSWLWIIILLRMR